MAGLPVVFDIPVKLLPEIVLSIVEPDERILSIFLPNANNRITNCIRCRYNRLFAFPFCVVCPCAMCCFCACGCCEFAIARQNFKFTKLHEGSILVVTEKRLIHFTPTVQGCCILPIAEQVEIVDWADYVSTTGRVTVNTNFGGRFNKFCCLCDFAAQCCFLHCIRKWEESHDSGCCAFEDTNVTISYAKQDDIPRELTFAPDLRAPQIRGILQAAAKKCKKVKKVNSSSNTKNTNASKPNSPTNNSNSTTNATSNASTISSNTSINVNSNRQSIDVENGGIKARESKLGPTKSSTGIDTPISNNNSTNNTKENGHFTAKSSPSNYSVSSTIDSSTLYTQGTLNHTNIDINMNDNDSYSDINSYNNGVTTKVIDSNYRGYAPLSIDVSSPRYNTLDSTRSHRAAPQSSSFNGTTPMSAFNAAADTVSTVSFDFNEPGSNLHNPSVGFGDGAKPRIGYELVPPQGSHKVRPKSSHHRNPRANQSTSSSIRHLDVDNMGGGVDIPSNLGIVGNIGNVDTVTNGSIGDYGNLGGYGNDNYEEPVDYDGNRYGIGNDKYRDFGNSSAASSSTNNLDQMEVVSGTFDGVAYSNVGDISISLVSLSSVKGSRSPRAKKSSRSRVNNAASFLANAAEASHSSQRHRKMQNNGTDPS